MKKSLGLLIAALLGAAPATYADDVLTGDTRLACEAILCLSSGDRPSECVSSIRRYFSIRHKKLGNTIKARRNFLKMCPSSSESAEMSGLVDAIANGAGRCDAQELNRMMRYSRFEKVCEQKNKYRFGRQYTFDENCQMVKKFYVRPDKPEYCKAYYDHGWTTAGDKVRYVGEEKNGGRWVDIR